MTVRTRENTTKEEYIELVKQELFKLLNEDEPCDRPGCLETTDVPCERCGRLGGVRQ